MATQQHDIIKSIFKVLDTNKMVTVIEDIMKSHPEFKDELEIARHVVTDKYGRTPFNEKIENIKNKALKDFSELSEKDETSNLDFKLLNKFKQLRVMIEFSNDYQRKCLKDFFGQDSASKDQLLKSLNDITVFHNSAPLGFMDMVYRDYTSKYNNMCKDFTFKKGGIKISVPTLKLSPDQDLSVVISQLFNEIHQAIRDTTSIVPLPIPSPLISGAQPPQSPIVTPPSPSPIINQPQSYNNNTFTPTLPPIIINIPTASPTTNSNNNNNNNNNINEIPPVQQVVVFGNELNEYRIEIIKNIFKSANSIKLSSTLEEMVVLFPQHLAEFNILKEILYKERDLITDRIRSIKNESTFDFVRELGCTESSLKGSQLFSRFIALVTMIEIAYMYQKHCLKSKISARSVTTQQKIIQDLIEFQKSVPMFKFSSMFTNYSGADKLARDFIFYERGQSITIKVLKLSPKEDISIIIPSLYNEIQQMAIRSKFQTPKAIVGNLLSSSTTNSNSSSSIIPTSTTLSTITATTTPTTSTNILKTIFKPPTDVFQLISTIEEMIRTHPNISSRLTIIKEVVSSKDGNKEFQQKIDTVKRNANRDIVDELGLFDQTIYDCWVTCRLLQEFSALFQRKLLRERLSTGNNQQIKVGLFSELSNHHNTIPTYFRDVAFRDCSDREITNFQFLIDGQSFSIPFFKIQQEDVSLVIKSLFSEVYVLVKQLKQSFKPSTHQIHHNHNPVVHQPVNMVVTPVVVPTAAPAAPTLLTSTDVIVTILKKIFHISNFVKDGDRVYNSVMDEKLVYPKYSGSFLEIREAIVKGKLEYKEFLKRIELVKADVRAGMKKNTSLKSILFDENKNPSRFNTIHDAIFAFRALVEFNFFHQKLQLRDKLETLKPSAEVSGEIINRLSAIHTTISKQMYKLHWMVLGSFKEQLNIFNYSLTDAANTNICIRVFKFGGEDITVFIKTLFFEAHNLIAKLLSKFPAPKLLTSKKLAASKSLENNSGVNGTTTTTATTTSSATTTGTSNTITEEEDDDEEEESSELDEDDEEEDSSDEDFSDSEEISDDDEEEVSDSDDEEVSDSESESDDDEEDDYEDDEGSSNLSADSSDDSHELKQKIQSVTDSLSLVKEEIKEIESKMKEKEKEKEKDSEMVNGLNNLSISNQSSPNTSTTSTNITTPTSTPTSTITNSNPNNNNNNNEESLIKLIFKSSDLSTIISTIEQLIVSHPQHSTMLIVARDIFKGSSDGNRATDEKMETIKRNAIKDIKKEIGFLDQNLYQRYITMRLMAEFSNQYQRKLLKDLIANFHVKHNATLNRQISVQLLTDLSTFHNYVPLYIYDMVKHSREIVYQNYQIVREFPFIINGKQISLPWYKLSAVDDIAVLVQQLFVEVRALLITHKPIYNDNSNSFKASLPPMIIINTNSIDESKISVVPTTSSVSIKSLAATNASPSSSSTTSTSAFSSIEEISSSASKIGILKTIFKYHHVNKIIHTIEEMIKLYPQYTKSLLIVKDIMLGNEDGKKDFAYKIDIIQGGAIRDYKSLMRVNDEKQILESELFNKFLAFRVFVEACRIFQRKCLKESVGAGHINPVKKQQVFADLCSRHNNVNISFRDIVTRDYNPSIASEFLITEGPTKFSVPVLKLSAQEDVSILIKQNYYEIQRLAKYLQSGKPISEYINGDSTIINNQTTTTIQPTTIQPTIQQQPQQRIYEIEDNSDLSILPTTSTTVNNPTTTTTTTTTPIIPQPTTTIIITPTSTLSDTEIVLDVLRNIFNSQNFNDKIKVLESIDSMVSLYPRQMYNLKVIKDIMMNNRAEFTEYLSKMIASKERFSIDIRKITGNLYMEQDESSKAMFANVLNSIVLHRSVVEFNNLYQKLQLKEKLDQQLAAVGITNMASLTLDQQSEMIDISRRLGKVHSKQSFDVTNFVGKGVLADYKRELIKEFSFMWLTNKKITIRIFKFSGEEISTFVKLLFDETRNLVNSTIKSTTATTTISNTIPRSTSFTEQIISNSNNNSDNEQQDEININSYVSDNSDNEIIKSRISSNISPGHLKKQHIESIGLLHSSNSTEILKEAFKDVSEIGIIVAAVQMLVKKFPEHEKRLQFIKFSLESAPIPFTEKIFMAKAKTNRDLPKLLQFDLNPSAFLEIANRINSSRVLLEFSHLTQRNALRKISTKDKTTSRKWQPIFDRLNSAQQPVITTQHYFNNDTKRFIPKQHKFVLENGDSVSTPVFKFLTVDISIVLASLFDDIQNLIENYTGHHSSSSTTSSVSSVSSSVQPTQPSQTPSSPTKPTISIVPTQSFAPGITPSSSSVSILQTSGVRSFTHSNFILKTIFSKCGNADEILFTIDEMMKLYPQHSRNLGQVRGILSKNKEMLEKKIVSLSSKLSIEIKKMIFKDQTIFEETLHKFIALRLLVTVNKFYQKDLLLEVLDHEATQSGVVSDSFEIKSDFDQSFKPRKITFQELVIGKFHDDYFKEFKAKRPIGKPSIVIPVLTLPKTYEVVSLIAKSSFNEIHHLIRKYQLENPHVNNNIYGNVIGGINGGSNNGSNEISNSTKLSTKPELPLIRDQIDVISMGSQLIIEAFLKSSPERISLLQANNIVMLSDHYEDHQSYKNSFKPIVTEEFRKQIETSFNDIDGVKLAEDGTISNLDKIDMNQSITIHSVEETSDESINVTFYIRHKQKSDEIRINDLILFKSFNEHSRAIFSLSKVTSHGELRGNEQKVQCQFIISNHTSPLIDKLYSISAIKNNNNYNDNVGGSVQLLYLKVSSCVTFHRELDALETVNTSPLFHLILNPDLQEYERLTQEKWEIPSLLKSQYTSSLNGSQLSAINESLSTKGITLIQGPPGTGKTHTIHSLISILLAINPTFKILVCAPSHAAVDEVAKRVLKKQLINAAGVQYLPYMVRIGLENNISPDIHEICMFTKKHDEKKKMLENAHICFSTLSASGSSLVQGSFKPNIVIVDESTQSCETSTIIPLSLGTGINKLILVGDPVQLPPTIFSKESINYGLNISLFERLAKAIPVSMLNVQYRMHPSISRFPSSQFYRDRLKDGDNVQDYSLDFYNNTTYGPIAFFDLVDSKEERGKTSVKNNLEIQMVFTLIKKLVQDYPPCKKFSFGIITPYKLQRKEIEDQQKSFNQRLDITSNTIDGMQGAEKDIIIFSCVRNENIGFLSDRRRINVGITRAKYGLFIIGNKTLLSKDRTWGPYIEYIESIERLTSINSLDIDKLKQQTIQYDLLHPEDLITDFGSDEETDEEFNENESKFVNKEDDEDLLSDSDGGESINNGVVGVIGTAAGQNKEEISQNIQSILNGGDIKDYPKSLIEIIQELQSFKSHISTTVLHNKKLLRDSFKNYILKFNSYVKYLESEVSLSSPNGSNVIIPNLSTPGILTKLYSIAKSKECKKRSTKEESFKRLTKVLLEGFANGKLNIYGSFLSGLSLNDSDIDVNFSTTQKEDISTIRQVSSFLNKTGDYKIQEKRLDAKVPIIRFVDLQSNVHFDMCFNSFMGQHNSILLREYTLIDSRVKPLILLVKWWAAQKDLNDASKDTFSSFCLVNMVIHFLQSLSPPILPNLQNPLENQIDLATTKLKANCRVENNLVRYYDWTTMIFNPAENTSNIGQLFYKFFLYYSTFNYSKYAISIAKGLHLRDETISSSTRGRLQVVDPFIETKNLGGSLTCDKFTSVLIEFTLMEYQLKTWSPDKEILDLFNQNLSLSFNGF